MFQLHKSISIQLFFIFFVLSLSLFVPKQINAQEISGLRYVKTDVLNNNPTIESQLYADSVRVDSSGNIIITGYNASSTDISIDFDFYGAGETGTGYSYIAKYTSNRVFMWGVALGDLSNSITTSRMVLDSDNNIYVTGYFRGTVDFDFQNGGDLRTATSTGWDIFFMKINEDGTYGWTRTFGSNTTLSDMPSDIKIDNTRGFVYIAGLIRADGADMNPHEGESDIKPNRGVFIAKYTTSGNYVWSNIFGAANTFNPRFAIQESTGNICLSMLVQSGTADLDPGAGTYTATGASDKYFITCLTSDNVFLNAYDYERYILISDLIYDSTNSLIVLGVFRGTREFNLGEGSAQLVSTVTNANDVFISKWDSNHNFQWVKSFPLRFSTSSGIASMKDILIDSSDRIYVLGEIHTTLAVNFNYDGGEDIHFRKGGRSAFLSVINPDGSYISTYSWGGIVSTNMVYPRRMHVSPNGNVLVIGDYKFTIDFDPGSDQNIFDTGLVNQALFLSSFFPIDSVTGEPILPSQDMSSNSDLSNIPITGGVLSPSFSPTTYNYYIENPPTDFELYIAPNISGYYSRITYDGRNIKSGETIRVPIGNGLLNSVLRVYSEDTTSYSTYNIAVFKERPIGPYYEHLRNWPFFIDQTLGLSTPRIEFNSNNELIIQGTFSTGGFDFDPDPENSVITPASSYFISKLNENGEYVNG
jgi:hypothetical protein